MQNVTYPTRELALQSTCAPFELSGCVRCGFCFNSRFDDSLITYDTDYDNHVESAAFHGYYETLARMLVARFDLDAGGVVYDVGCGQGTFLKTLCRLSPRTHGVGLDPSCDPLEEMNVTLLRAKFSEDLIKADGKLIVLRHVLEHIHRPVEFLRALRVAAGDIPIFVEVPDTTWIFRTRAFWDFCYEHCNYFVPSTLSVALRLAGFDVLQQETSFGGQYQWAICAAAAGPTSSAADSFKIAKTEIESAREYAQAEEGYLQRATSTFIDSKRDGSCAIWGMATKGVVLASTLPPDLVDGGVDSNSRKQGRFAPGSGLEIHPPDWLGTLEGPVTAIVMNRNYFDEIDAQVRALGMTVDLRAL